MNINGKNSADPDIERALNWLLSFLPAGEWALRKEAVEEHIESLVRPKMQKSEVQGLNRLIGGTDRIAWYLYLVETSLYEPYRTEVYQASRVLPLFRRLGVELDRVLTIGGVEDKVRHLLAPAKADPDAVLFEILIALLWVRNGWQNVAFIAPNPEEKRPDFRAVTSSEEWFVEAKRMTSSSGYSHAERGKWLRMWDRLTDSLEANRYPFIFDIVFHVELETLDDDFVREQLERKLKLVVCPCKLISNEIWDVSINLVDLPKIKKHLETQYVKTHSRQLQELVGGSWNRGRGFTMIMDCKPVRMGGERGVNQYIDQLKWAAGAHWSCDAERAQEKKARDIRRHLAEAVSQLPDSGAGAIHVGIETLDGESVELERFQRIVNTVSKFDAQGKDLRWIYCHLYESYSPPEESWLMDETVYKFGPSKKPSDGPLKALTSVCPEDGTSGVHWLRDAP